MSACSHRPWAEDIFEPRVNSATDKTSTQAGTWRSGVGYTAEVHLRRSRPLSRLFESCKCFAKGEYINQLLNSAIAITLKSTL
ncbi:hypothetical protein chiPu_0000690 [Chiloscyllium punctatum]|uniref:Uncharacterized protein n=1 Tax=Chiloscyllium punctatum TaxID=137246 RepID=A0A401RW07_CHIPU|nr:hypothetical protein [Chiloscyllium punctatum]